MSVCKSDKDRTQKTVLTEKIERKVDVSHTDLQILIKFFFFIIYII